MKKILLTMGFFLSLLLFISTAKGQTGYWGLYRADISSDAVMHKFGSNSDIDIAAEETVWSVGGDFVLFPDDSLLEVVSGSTADDTSGTGALTMRIFGIDSSFKKKTIDVGLGGQDTVAIGDSIMMIYRVQILTAGTGLENAGLIKVQTVVGNTVMADIPIGYSQTVMSVFPISAGETGYLHHWTVSHSKNSANATFYLKVKPFGGPWLVKGFLHARATGTSSPVRHHAIPMKIDEKSIIQITAATDTDDTPVTAEFNVLLWGSVE